MTAELIAMARAGDGEAFGRLVESSRTGALVRPDDLAEGFPVPGPGQLKQVCGHAGIIA